MNSTKQLLLVGLSLYAGMTANADAAEFSGQVQPHPQITVASAQTGILAKVLVREGQTVQQGQVLAVLDSRVLEAELAIARQQRDARGALDAAETEVVVRRNAIEQIRAQRLLGRITTGEIHHGQDQLALARARLRASREMREHNKLLYRRLELLLQQRTIRAPVSGVVSKVYKHSSEMVSPNSADIVQLSQIRSARATFQVPKASVQGLRPGQTMQLLDGPNKTPLAATLLSVGGSVPATSANDNTISRGNDLVPLTVKLENRRGSLRPGQTVRLVVPDAEGKTALSK